MHISAALRWSIICWKLERWDVKRKGSNAPSVVACTWLHYTSTFELGSGPTAALVPVKLNHPHCAKCSAAAVAQQALTSQWMASADRRDSSQPITRLDLQRGGGARAAPEVVMNVHAEAGERQNSSAHLSLTGADGRIEGLLA